MPSYPTYKLGEIVDFYLGYGFPKNLQGKKTGKYPFYKVGDISKNVQNGFSHLLLCDNFIDDNDLSALKGVLLPESTLVFAKIGEALKLNRRALTKEICLVDNNVVGIKAKTDKCLDLYLFYYFKTIKLEKYSRATTVPSVRKSDIELIPIPLPSLSTQHAIVTRIETLFAELDKAEEHLRTAQQQLKIYKQAVLNHWLNNDGGKWEMVKLKDICLSISDGDHLPPKRTTQGIPFITISDIKGNCIDYSDVSYMTEEYYESLSDSRKAQIGDILYTVTGSFGIPVMVEDDKKFCFQRHIGLVRPNPNLAAQKWLYYMMQSPIIYSQANEKATGTAQKTVTLTVLRDFNLPLPPLSDQQRIVQEIESRLSQASTSSAYIENALQQAEALRQSILKKAFSGELVVSTSSTTSKGG